MSELLPSSWAFAKLGDLCEVVSGSTPRTTVPEYWNGEIAWITPDDLSGYSQKTIANGARNITQDGYDSCSTRLVPAGSVLFTSRAPIGYVAIASHPVCTNQGFKSFVPTEALTSDYLYWFLRHATPEIRKLGSGTTFPELSKARAREVEIPVAPIAEQRRIVAAIEEDFSRVDDADDSLQRAQRRLRNLKAALLSAALKGWPERTLGEFAEVFVGTTPSRSAPELWEGDVPWVSSGEVAFCRIHQTRETISPAAVTSADRLHPPGTVLLAMIGEGKTRGQAAILDVAATHNQNSAAIRLDSQFCTPEWLFYVLMARYQETRRAGSGAQQPALNRARVQALSIPLPPLEDQGRLVEDIERQLSLSDTLTDGINRACRRSAVLRRSILEEAFSGRLVVQDPSDERASLLLERITVERAAAQKPSRGKRKIPA
jgi:type I restriction enzyme, S subunit